MRKLFRRASNDVRTGSGIEEPVVSASMDWSTTDPEEHERILDLSAHYLGLFELMDTPADKIQVPKISLENTPNAASLFTKGQLDVIQGILREVLGDEAIHITFRLPPEEDSGR